MSSFAPAIFSKEITNFFTHANIELIVNGSFITDPSNDNEIMPLIRGLNPI